MAIGHGYFVSSLGRKPLTLVRRPLRLSQIALFASDLFVVVKVWVHWIIRIEKEIAESLRQRISV